MANQSARRGERRRPRPRREVAARTPPLADVLRRVCSDLTAVGARYALVGGLAVSARAEPRLTRDVDLAVATTGDDDAEASVRALASRGYHVATVLEHTGAARLATVRLRAPDDRVLVDLLFAASGIEVEIVAAAQPLEILPALRVPDARTGHLIAMKLLAMDARRRPQDADDIRALLAVAAAAERRLVTTAIAAITTAGSRGGAICKQLGSRCRLPHRVSDRASGTPDLESSPTRDIRGNESLLGRRVRFDGRERGW